MGDKILNEEMIANSRFQRLSEELMTEEIDGEVIMMTFKSGEFLGLNPLGSRIWAILETPSNLVQIVNQIMDEYSVSEGECREEVADFLNSLYERKLIHVLD